MEQEAAERFAASWVEAWNAHDVEAVLAHFAEDVTFSSPLVPVLAGEPSGVLHGKDALRSYWQEGLRRIPDLRFDLDRVHAGVGVVAITYRNQTGRACCETVELGDDGLGRRGWATYGPPVA